MVPGEKRAGVAEQGEGMHYLQRFARWSQGSLLRSNDMQPAVVKRRLLTGAISAPLAMAALTIILLWHLQIQRVYTQWLEHSDHVLSEARLGKTAILEGQAGFDAYLASSNESYLTEWRTTSK